MISLFMRDTKFGKGMNLIIKINVVVVDGDDGNKNVNFDGH